MQPAQCTYATNPGSTHDVHWNHGFHLLCTFGQDDESSLACHGCLKVSVAAGAMRGSEHGKLVLWVGEDDASRKSSSSHNDWSQVATLPSTVEDPKLQSWWYIIHTSVLSLLSSHFSDLLVKSCRIFAHYVRLHSSNLIHLINFTYPIYRVNWCFKK